MVSEYQIKNLPCPQFAEHNTTEDDMLRITASKAVSVREFARAFEILHPALIRPPFALAVCDIVTNLVHLIVDAEKQRGEIGRSERSALCAEAQPYQDLIDRLLYAMAGLTEEEAQGLEERLATML